MTAASAMSQLTGEDERVVAFLGPFASYSHQVGIEYLTISPSLYAHEEVLTH